MCYVSLSHGVAGSITKLPHANLNLNLTVSLTLIVTLALNPNSKPT